MTHIPSPAFFEACEKKAAGKPLTTKDREAIAIERRRTEALFQRGYEERLPPGPSSNVDRATAILAAIDRGESRASLAIFYNCTRDNINKAITRARKKVIQKTC